MCVWGGVRERERDRGHLTCTYFFFEFRLSRSLTADCLLACSLNEFIRTNERKKSDSDQIR